jgi:aryl-alcohol dehydrogenase-like predicted oxidoreductase
LSIAERKGLSASQLTLLRVKDQPGITAPIIGPRTEDQLADALKVLEMTLDAETAAELDQVVPPGSAVANFHNTSGWMKARFTWPG